MVRFTLILLIILCSCPLHAQLLYQLPGARAAGLGGAAVATENVWSLQHNIAGLAQVREITIAAGTQTRFSLPELSTAGIMGAVPFKQGTAGASFTRYGFGAYSLQEATVGYAHNIQLVSIGLQAGMVQMATTGFGSRAVPVLSGGGIAKLFPKLSIGAYAYNLTQSKINKETNEYLPTLLRLGVSWLPINSVRLLLETEKEVDETARLKTGLEYELKKLLQVRTGISTQPLSLHAGFGLMLKAFQFDYALQHHRHIGLMHHLSIGRSFSKAE